MKKLLTACAVAGLSAAVFGDVTSANVVGYVNSKGDQGTYKLMGASFLTVGNKENKIGLSTLKITGYEESDFLWTYGLFQASFQLLKGDGSPNVTYFYEDSSEDGEKWNGGKWTLGDGTEITPDNEVWLDQGEGLWLTMSGDVEVESLQLVSAGQVFAGDCGVECDQGTYKAISNPLPGTLKLSECEIHGYEDSDFLWTYGLFQASFQVLKGDGSPKVTYFYEDSSEDGEKWNGGKWTLGDGTEITSDNDVDLIPGQGLWITMSGDVEVDCVSMVFPKVIEK